MTNRIEAKHHEEHGTELYGKEGNRHFLLGRITTHEGNVGYQPAFLMQGLLSADTLREIANLIEKENNND